MADRVDGPARTEGQASRVNDMWLTTGGDRVEVFSRPVLVRSLLRTRVKGIEWRWHVRAAGNNEIVESGEGYVRRIDAVAAAERHHPRWSEDLRKHP